MGGNSDEKRTTGFASPPCFMHELDPEYSGLRPPVSNQQHIDVKRWRNAERERLLAERLSIDSKTRKLYSSQIANQLNEILTDFRDVTISCYWPIRGEPDLRPWMKRLVKMGGRFALPVVVAKNQPLVFKCYNPGEPLERGIWNIPVPRNGEPVCPDIIIMPIVGYDPNCFRLGYGGGFFDRTLANITYQTRVIGVAFEKLKIPTIYPQPHDIPMEMIVNELGVHRST